MPQASQPLGVVLGLRRDARQHLHALRACLLQGGYLGLLRLLQAGKLRVLRLKLAIDLPQMLQVGLYGLDLEGARATEIAVVNEHSACLRRAALIQQQLQRLLPPDEVGRPKLSGKRAPITGEVGLELAPLCLELRPLCGARLTLLAQAIECRLRFPPTLPWPAAGG